VSDQPAQVSYIEDINNSREIPVNDKIRRKIRTCHEWHSRRRGE
jgi:hypothetical protein